MKTIIINEKNEEIEIELPSIEMLVKSINNLENNLKIIQRKSKIQKILHMK